MSTDLLSQARAFHYASDLPQEVWDALSRNEAVSNIILPFAKKKAQTFPHGGDDKQLWIALFDKSGDVAFVLSCTKGPLGNYPIFIVSCRSPAQGDVIDIADAMSALVRLLRQHVAPKRIFSVFSTANITRAFAAAFETQDGKEHGIQACKEPYYEAVFSSCKKEKLAEGLDLTFRPRDGEDPVVHLRRANMSDLKGIQRLCQGFSKTSPPYVLDDERAKLEAKTMIENKQVWVHVITRGGEEEIACLVATTRESATVTAVTKVFTAPQWRGRGCALRLLHRVCHEILSGPKAKECVVLYVGTSDDLGAARKVYSKIGFQGLKEEQIKQMSDEEKWLEIGFEPTEIGYW